MTEENDSCVVVSTRLSISVIVGLLIHVVFVAFLVGVQFNKIGKLEEDVDANKDMRERVTRVEEQILRVEKEIYNNNCLIQQFRQDFKDFTKYFYENEMSSHERGSTDRSSFIPGEKN